MIKNSLVFLRPEHLTLELLLGASRANSNRCSYACTNPFSEASSKLPSRDHDRDLLLGLHRSVFVVQATAVSFRSRKWSAEKTEGGRWQCNLFVHTETFAKVKAVGRRFLRNFENYRIVTLDAGDGLFRKNT